MSGYHTLHHMMMVALIDTMQHMIFKHMNDIIMCPWNEGRREGEGGFKDVMGPHMV